MKKNIVKYLMIESIHHLLNENSCVTYLVTKTAKQICGPDGQRKRGKLRKKLSNLKCKWDKIDGANCSNTFSK